MSLLSDGVENIRSWWRTQQPRFEKVDDRGQRYTDGNARELAELHLRERVGRLLQIVDPGISACYRCQMPWTFVEHHSTNYSASSGCFPLCEKCWRELGHSSYRMKYYRALWESWNSFGGNDTSWEQIERAVIAEDSNRGWHAVPVDEVQA